MEHFIYTQLCPYTEFWYNTHSHTHIHDYLRHKHMDPNFLHLEIYCYSFTKKLLPFIWRKYLFIFYSWCCCFSFILFSFLFFFFYIITLLWKFFHSLFSQTFTRILITIRTETSRHSKFHLCPSSSAHTHTLTPHHRACVFSASLLLRLLLAWRFFVVHLYSLTYCHCWSPAMLLLLL